MKIKPIINVLITSIFILTQVLSPLEAHDFDVPGGETASLPSNPNPGQTPCQGDSESCGTNPVDPVYLDRGEFIYRSTDLMLPGRGINLELKREYRSNSAYHSQFGYGWDINYNMKIRKMSDGSFTFLTGTNRKEGIQAGGQGPAGFYDTLEVQPNGTYILTRKNGDKVFFNADGNATRMEDRFGNFLTFTYDPAGKLPLIGPSAYFVNQTEGVVALEYRLTRVEDAQGRYFQFFYDARGRLDYVVDSAGRTVDYEYDANNDLKSITSPVVEEYPDGLTTSFTYDTKHKLETVTNPRNQTFVTNVYNSDGKVESQTLLGRGITALVYNTTNHTTDITDRKGFRTLWTYDPDGRPIRREQFTAGFHAGEPTSYITIYEYDTNGELKKTIFPRGNIIENTYDTKGNLLIEQRKPVIGSLEPDIVTTFTYEPNFNLIKTITDPRGNMTTYTYDYEVGQGNQGKLMKITFPTVNKQTIETSFTYTTFGRIETVIDPNGIVTKYTYNPSTGYLETITQGFSTEDAATITLGYDSFGNISSVKDARNNTYALEQNALHQLRKATSPLGFETFYAYDESGNLKHVKRQADSEGNAHQITQYTYTPHNELETITDNENNITVFQYDNNMNRVKVIDPELQETNYVYDERNLLFTATDAKNALTQYDYDSNGNLSKIKDGNTNPTQYFYDDFDRLKETKYPNLVSEFYTYDATSNLKTKTNGANEVTQYDYDELNRLKLKEFLGCSVNVCGGDVSYGYDAASRMLQAASSTASINYQYDNLNRVTKETTTLSNGSAYSVLSKYDKSGNRTNLTYPNSGKFSYDYDSMNRLIQINRGFKLTLADSAFSVQRIADSREPVIASRGQDGGEAISIMSSPKSLIGDPDSRLQHAGMTDSEGGITSGLQPLSGRQLIKFTYDPLSRRIDLERVPTDLHTKYTYDTLNRITSITSSNPEALGDILYLLYDKLGNRKEENNQLVPDHNFHFTYGYNERYELTQTQDPSLTTHHSYQYDATGNRLQSTENGNQTTYVPNNLNQYQTVNAQTYSYDPKGNLTNDGVNTYEYDYENRLIHVSTSLRSATLSGGEAIYGYDPFGRRITKTTTYDLQPTTELFIHDQDHILETYNCSLNLQTCTQTHSFLYSNKIDEPLLITYFETPGIGKDYYYHQDALGNITAITDSTNQVTEYVEYNPYGEPHFFDPDSNPILESTINNPFLFTGRFYDVETGLYDYRNRTEFPKLGRFGQRDPIGILGQDMNLYRFVVNNPINFSDPFGLLYVSLEAGASAGAAVGVGGYAEGSAGIAFGTSKGCGKRWVAAFTRTVPNGFGQLGLAFFGGGGGSITFSNGDIGTAPEISENINVFLPIGLNFRIGYDGSQPSSITFDFGKGFGIGATVSSSQTTFTSVGSQSAMCLCDGS